MFLENDFAIYTIIEEILHVRYKHVVIDLPGAICIVKDRLALQKGQFMPVLCDIREIKEIKKPARSYLSIEGSAFVKAVAFVLESEVSESLSTFYLRTNRPSMPSEAFDDINSALEFLNSFK